jgi:pimeloyl-ACP methyl ester carboxylesterase
MRIVRRLTAGVVGLAVLAYAALAGALYAQQRTILFRPDPARVAPASAGLPGLREISLNGPGAPRLVAWEATPGDATKPVVLYLHGNSGNLARRSVRFRQLTANGAGLLAVSWRGYGGSEGEPSETGFRDDARAAIDHLTAQGVSPDRLVIFGESLGTGVAIMKAAELPVRALILDSPYESIAAIASERFWWLPVNWLIRDPFRAIEAAPRVTAPVLATACTDDWLTPYAGAQRLLEAFRAPKRLITFDRRCHIPAFAGASEAIMALIESGRL